MSPLFRVRTLAIVALMVASAAIAILLLDGALRVAAVVAPRRGAFNPVPLRHALTDWIDVLPPGYSGTLSGPDFTVSVHAGSLGLRERDLDVLQLQRQRPVVFLGDSYFFGWGVEQQDRMSERLAVRLGEHGYPVPVVNLSFPGWGTYHYLDVWRKLLPELHPRRVVVSTFIGNDFTDNLRQAWRGDSSRGPTSEEAARTMGIGLSMQLAARELMSTSPLVSMVNGALWSSPAFRRLFNGLEIRNDRIALYESRVSDLQVQLYSATESAFDDLAELSRTTGVTTLVVLIPDHLQVLMPELFEGYVIDQPQQRLTTMLRARGIETLDLLPILRARATPDDIFFRQDKHWNAKGHALIAEILHDALREGSAGTSHSH